MACQYAPQLAPATGNGAAAEIQTKKLNYMKFLLKTLLLLFLSCFLSQTIFAQDPVKVAPN